MSLSLIFMILFVGILLILSGISSASETSLIASSSNKINKHAQDGNHKAKYVQQLRKNMGRSLSTLLVANNLVNITASTLTTSIFIHLFGENGVFYATALLGFFIILYGEVLPKIYAIHFPEKTVMRFSPLLKAVSGLLNPVARVVDSIARLTLKMLGAKTLKDSSDANPEELRGFIDVYRSESSWEAEERAMLRGIIDLAAVEVGEIMTHRKNVLMVNVNDAKDKIIQDSLEAPYSRIPLWEGNPENIIGVINTKTLSRVLRKVNQDLGKLNLKEISFSPWFIPESTRLLDQLQSFRKRREHFAIVVDEYGAVLGVVTLEDILEEIVGQIQDEHDLEVSGIKRVSKQEILVSGDVTLRDLNREFNLSLPDEEASTIAGLVIHESRQIPAIGDKITVNNLDLEVCRKHRHQILLIRINFPENF